MAYDAMLYSFLVPVAVIMLINTAVFFTVMYHLFRKRNRALMSNQSDRKMAALHFQAAVSIFIILGKKTEFVTLNKN